jgi:hypothetical protein
LRAVVNDFGVADDEMIHCGFLGEEILGAICAGAFGDCGAI